MLGRTVLFASVLFIGALASVSVEAQQQSNRSAQAGGATLKPLASIKEVMEALIIPASEAVFKAGSDAPKDAAGWAPLRTHALALAEAANLLLMEGRAVDTNEWTRFAIAERDAAVVALKAIDARDADALSNASDVLYETCDNCHKKYMKK